MTDRFKEDAVSDTARDTRDRMEDAAQAARDAAHREADAATRHVANQAGDTVQDAANAASAAAREVPEGSVQEQAADALAARLQDVAGVLRDTDLKTAAGQVTGFARENPMLFLGGAALLGFAATRFLKASDRSTPGAAGADDAGDDPWTGHVSSTPVARRMPDGDTREQSETVLATPSVPS